MSRKSTFPVGAAFDFARLGMDSWMVIGLRMAKLAAGGPGAAFEAQRMVLEKMAAATQAQATFGLALAAGASHEAAGDKVLRGYKKRVAANRRRLMRKG